jgi:hypothetical protein
MSDPLTSTSNRETRAPTAAAFEHFRLYAPGHFHYLRGNCKTFGLF